MLRLNPRTEAPQPYILSPREIDQVLEAQSLKKKTEGEAADAMALDG